LAKTDSSPVTVADLSVQVLIALSLRRDFPSDRLIAEETSEQLEADEALLQQLQDLLAPRTGRCSKREILESFQFGKDGDSGFSWVLDPIDGTKGFLRGDQYAIALAGLDGSDLRFGLLGCPRLKTTGAERGDGVIGGAYRGKGAWQKSLGSEGWSRVAVSARSQAQEVRLLRSFEASHTNEGQLESFVEAEGIAAPPVRLDSQAKYLLLARGDAEAVVRCLSPKRPDYREKIWDQAAGAIMVTEAGGRIEDLCGKPLDFSTGPTLSRNVGVRAHNGLLDDLNWSILMPGA